MTLSSKWRKILYIQQPYEDNHTDETFLDEMRKNVNTRMYDFRSVIYESGVVSQQLSTICIFVGTFYFLNVGVLNPSTLCAMLFASFVAGAVFQKLTNGGSIDTTSCILVSTFVFTISPILKTLTKSISTDTIYAMSIGMLMANLLFHDYGAGVAIVSKAISLNTGIFAAVCLGSRLPSTWHVYVFVMTAIVLFALFPQFRKHIKATERRLYIVLTESLAFVGTVLLLHIDTLAACALVGAHVFITFLFPVWMVKLQKLKNNINGPWDEAKIVHP